MSGLYWVSSTCDESDGCEEPQPRRWYADSDWHSLRAFMDGMPTRRRLLEQLEQLRRRSDAMWDRSVDARIEAERADLRVSDLLKELAR